MTIIISYTFQLPIIPLLREIISFLKHMSLVQWKNCLVTFSITNSKLIKNPQIMIFSAPVTVPLISRKKLK